MISRAILPEKRFSISFSVDVLSIIQEELLAFEESHPMKRIQYISLVYEEQDDGLFFLLEMWVKARVLTFELQKQERGGANFFSVNGRRPTPTAEDLQNFTCFFFYKQVSAPCSGSDMLKTSANLGSVYAYYMLTSC